jgi:RNA polymerase sigma-70 factor (ECF subfamily)
VQEPGGPDLLEAARQGDADALDALLRQYQPQVYRFGMKMCRDPEAARDILQDTLLAAARTLAGFRAESSLSTWLFTIARSFCIKKRRRRASAPRVVSLEAEPASVRAVADRAADPERRLADHEVAVALDAAIDALDPQYREALVLRDVEGLSAEDTARVTGVTVAAIKSRLHRARRSVRDRLVSRLAPPPPAGATSGGCPDVVEMLSRHLEGEIAADACAEMERHVAVCPRCHAACDSLRRTLRLCRSTPLPRVPEDLQQSIRQGIRHVLAAESHA